MTKAKLTSSFGIGIYEYNRKQNSRSSVELMIHIDPKEIKNFEELSGTKLSNPIKIQTN